MAAKFSVAGLAMEWDGVESLRSRVRDGGLLEMGPANQDPSNKVAVLNAEMLVPLLLRLAACGLHLPPVPELRVKCLPSTI